jgi:hypothetical protein
MGLAVEEGVACVAGARATVVEEEADVAGP